MSGRAARISLRDGCFRRQATASPRFTRLSSGPRRGRHDWDRGRHRRRQHRRQRTIFLPLPAGADIRGSAELVARSIRPRRGGVPSMQPTCSPWTAGHGRKPRASLLVPVDGSPVREMLDDTAGYYWTPAWSPDGSTLATVRRECRRGVGAAPVQRRGQVDSRAGGRRNRPRPWSSPVCSWGKAYWSWRAAVVPRQRTHRLHGLLPDWRFTACLRCQCGWDEPGRPRRRKPAAVVTGWRVAPGQSISRCRGFHRPLDHAR